MGVLPGLCETGGQYNWAGISRAKTAQPDSKTEMKIVYVSAFDSV